MISAPKKLESLSKRAEFLAVASSGMRWVAPGFVLQVGGEHPPLPCPRFGLTATKKIGNAVTRNRARRRLRALAHQILPQASTSHDYVLIARVGTTACSFSDLKNDLQKGLKRLKLWEEHR
ncbi:MAG: ribonuclease P protein component [Alphaproteobacteria bacterium]|nr:ribonuclease P protein component [Alphaproteobacteria bacterium]